MSEWMLATIAIAMIVAVSQWLSVRVVASADLDVLPLPCRLRVERRRAHTRLVYLVCAVAVLACAVLQLHELAR
jgi:hypothetical protein